MTGDTCSAGMTVPGAQSGPAVRLDRRVMAAGGRPRLGSRRPGTRDEHLKGSMRMPQTQWVAGAPRTRGPTSEGGGLRDGAS